MTERQTSGRIRPLENGDLELILQWRNSPEVRCNMFTSHLISPAEHRKWYEEIRTASNCLYFLYEEDDVLCCVVGLASINKASRHSDTFIYGAPERPRGSDRRACTLLCEYAFNELSLHRLTAQVIAYNTPSINMYLHLGFKKEGILRDHHFFEGQFHDVHCFGILEDEWKEKLSSSEEGNK